MEQGLFIKYFEGISGEFVEFQIAQNEINSSGNSIEHWKHDSFYADSVRVCKYKQFEKYLKLGWEFNFDELGFKNAISLANDLLIIPDCKVFSKWIITNMKPNLYLRILGA